MTEDGLGRYQPYSAYKASGIEWLGDIPSNWDSEPLKVLLIRNDSGGWGDDFDDEGTIVLRSTEQTADGQWQVDSPARRKLTPREAAEAQLIKDDLVVTKSSGSERHIGKTTIVNRHVASLNAAFSNFMQRIRFGERGDPRFYWYILNSPVARQQFGYYSTTTTGLGNLNGTIIGNLTVPSVPIAEQQAIGRFLDYKTSEIDTLIAAKKRLISLLQEKRAALITQAVTKGLDPSVPMKDSGIEWLGEIPAHWEVKPLKFMSTLQTGLTLGKTYVDSVFLVSRPYLRVANVQDGYLDLDEITYIDMPEKDVPRYELRENDVVMTEGGDFDKLGRGYVWQEQIKGCLHQNHIFAVRTSPNVLEPHFLAAVTASNYGRAYFTATSKQSTNLASTNSRKLMNFPVAVPDVPEQRVILKFIDKASTELDNTTAKVQEGIERLQEYRTALISAAVTGKIDVRDYA